jgi:hypothetical protein
MDRTAEGLHHSGARCHAETTGTVVQLALAVHIGQ